ncbi:MAG: septum formation inhibitor Maf [Pontiellaceae bacterium]|nr:septum formation inhibitor Maf [Pontiellaceae bacterium]MBN2783752.1 septum formation inhibitor Maf [Pontiellaceae bacterium]
MQRYPHIQKLILASASPRRKELLGLLEIPFSVEVPDIDETPLEGETARTFSKRIAREKAEAIELPPETTAIAADTIVVLDSTILGKPDSAETAIKMLSALSGRTHEVITSVCVRSTTRCVVFSSTTEVTFRVLNDGEIRNYVDSGCPLDKAGGYAIQGGAAHMVQCISGSYTNVVGLPLSELHETLDSF